MPTTSAGASGATECVGTLPSGTYGDVEVPAGQSCTIEEGAVIEGKFEAKDAADIVIVGTTIHGNVTIDGATGVVVILSSSVIGDTTHIYGNVTIKNTDQSEVPIDQEPVVFVAGAFLGDGFPDEGEPFLYSTLHIHGNLTLDDNEVFNFFAGDLFSSLVIDGNVSITDNVLADLDLHVYGMDIGGNLTVRRNTAQAFTSVLCNNVAGNVMIDDNFNPGVDPGFGPAGAVWAQLQVATDCAEFNSPEIPSGNATVSGNLTINNNTIGDGNNDFAQIVVFATTVEGHLDVSRNEVNAAVVSADSFIVIDGVDVGKNLTCKENSLDPILGTFFPTGIDGKDKCFGVE